MCVPRDGALIPCLTYFSFRKFPRIVGMKSQRDRASRSKGDFFKRLLFLFLFFLDPPRGWRCLMCSYQAYCSIMSEAQCTASVLGQYSAQVHWHIVVHTYWYTLVHKVAYWHMLVYNGTHQCSAIGTLSFWRCDAVASRPLFIRPLLLRPLFLCTALFLFHRHVSCRWLWYRHVKCRWLWYHVRLFRFP